MLFFLLLFPSRWFWTSSSLDVSAGVTQEEGHTGFLIHLPSAVDAFIFFARRISAVTFPRRPWSRILCTDDLIVLHLFGIYIFIYIFYFVVRKNPSYRDTNLRLNVSEGYEVTSWATGATGSVYSKTVGFSLISYCWPKVTNYLSLGNLFQTLLKRFCIFVAYETTILYSSGKSVRIC